MRHHEPTYLASENHPLNPAMLHNATLFNATLRRCGGAGGPIGERFPGSSGSSEFDPSTTVLCGRPQGTGPYRDHIGTIGTMGDGTTGSCKTAV